MKKCSKCGETKPFEEFNRRTASKDGRCPECKICKRKRDNEYLKRNPLVREKRKRALKKYREVYKGKTKILNSLWRKNHPWLSSYYSAYARCTDPNKENYNRYGGRGIRFRITKKEIKALWFRDKAYLMKKPSIDRIDNDGDYCFENCQFIEFFDNTQKGLQVQRDEAGRDIQKD